MKITGQNKIVLFISCCYMLGCSVQDEITSTSKFRRAIERERKNHSAFIMYSGKDTFAVTSIMTERARREFTVQLDLIDSLQRPRNSKLPPSDKNVFLYMKDSTSYTLNEPHTIPLKNIRLIRLKESGQVCSMAFV